MFPMFAVSSRAFTLAVPRASRVAANAGVHSSRTIKYTSTRFMSSSAQDPSVVDRCTQKIQKALETDDVVVTGAYDDPNGSHISITVVSELFQGKRPVQRQQLVYKSIWEELQGPVHAVDSLVCKTPDEKKMS